MFIFRDGKQKNFFSHANWRLKAKNQRAKVRKTNNKN